MKETEGRRQEAEGGIIDDKFRDFNKDALRFIPSNLGMDFSIFSTNEFTFLCSSSQKALIYISFLLFFLVKTFNKKRFYRYATTH
jgi:hypothetical protein